MISELIAETRRADGHERCAVSAQARRAGANRAYRKGCLVGAVAAQAALLALVVGVVLVTARPAYAYERPALLETVAGYFAMRPAEVRCPSTAEWIGDPIWGAAPNPQRAWGYTDMTADYIVVHPLLCAGAAAVSNPLIPPWQRATGVLVLVHEAYHLRRWRWRRNEGKVECRAIRHFRAGAQMLGASPELANDLLPYALAAHGRMVTTIPRIQRPRVQAPPLDLADDALT